MAWEHGRDETVGECAVLARLRPELARRGLDRVDSELAPDPDPEGRTLGAVLILLYPSPVDSSGQTVPHLALTRRTEALRSHRGQISLPGGRYDVGDGSLLRTALREAREELAVDPAALEVWGRLEPERIVVSHYLVAPFVAYAPARPDFRPNPSEVAELIEVPLPLLLDPATLAEEVWEIRGAPRQVAFYRHGEHKIWGATARVLGQLVALLTPESAADATTRLAPGTVLPEGDRGEG
jgi:8-oxo-dGTP pyrophosphatase MutT (NUDIX family)